MQRLEELGELEETAALSMQAAEWDETEELEKNLKLVRAMENVRASWEDTWREIRDYIYPHSALALDNDAGELQGRKRYAKILDSYPEKAVRVLAAGMLGGMLSPSRMWFQLGFKDWQARELSAEAGAWLGKVRDILLHYFNRSDIYGAMHTLFREMALYGQGVLLIEGDAVNGFNFTPLSCGEYYLDQNEKGEVDTLLRKIYYTPRQMLEKFNPEELPEAVLQASEHSQVDRRFEVLHLIKPNSSYSDGQYGTARMAWDDIYIIRSGGQGTRLIRRNGFETKPFVAPRWEKMSSSVYGHAPARTALADVKTLYEIDKQNLTTLKKHAAPPVTVKGNMKNSLIDLSPNGVTYVPAMNADAGVAPIYQPQNSFQMTEGKLEKLQQSIREVFYNDLFMPIMQRDKRMSATEINSINVEKMGNITPVIELLEKEALDHIFSRCFNILLRLGGIIPRPPQQLIGSEIKIDYISVLAQAQKVSELAAIEQFVGFVGNCAQYKREVLDYINADKLVEKYGRVLSIDSDIIASEQEVKQRRREQKSASGNPLAALAAAGAAQPQPGAVPPGAGINPLQAGKDIGKLLAGVQ